MVSKVYGIVIKESDAGETGKRITAITKEHGKMLLSALGSKNVKSSILAATQLFTYCEFSLFEGRGFYSITQADVLESFYGIRNDFERLAYGAYILELTDRASFEELENNSAFELLLRTLVVLSSGKQEPRLTALIYIIRLLKEYGFMGDASYCAGCGEKLDGSAYYSDMCDGLYCHRCAQDAQFKLSTGALNAEGQIKKRRLASLFSFNVSDEVLKELWNYADLNRRAYFGDNYKTLEYINNMKF